MKLKLLRFLTAFYSFFLIMEVLRELLLRDKLWRQLQEDAVYTLYATFRSSLLFLCYALFAYLFLFYCYKKAHKYSVILGLVSIGIGVIGLRFLVEEVILKAITGYGNYYEGTTALYYIGDNLYYAILYSAFGISWFFIHYAMVRDRQQRQLMLENKKTELSFLKSQLNPHFLFNMLNNIYALINMGSDRALMATEKLSALLRYSLYESDQEVTLGQEIQSVKDYVALQELRFRESVHLNLHLDTALAESVIAPFILLPLVENSFKHGVVTDGERPIIVSAVKMKDTIQITVSNHIAQREKDAVGGIGVENLKKRLQLIYNGRHTFKLHVTEEIYTTIITLH